MTKTLPSFFGHDLMRGAYFTQGHMPAVGSYGLVRFHDCGVAWNETHKGPGLFDWSTMDAIIAKLPAGCEIMMTLVRTPPWASMRPNEPGPCGGGTGCAAPPIDVDGANAHWKEYVTVLVKRYSGRIKLWEIWNEANGAYKGSFWSGTIPQLVRMQSDAYTIIKEIDTMALVGGPSTDGESNQFQWLDGYLSAGGGKYQDAVTFHAYLHDQNPDPAPTLIKWLAQFRAMMAKHGISGQELWQTEGSWAHGTLGAGPLNSDQQVAYLQQMMILCWAAGVSRFVWYSYDNLRTAFLWNGMLTPAGKAYAELYTWLVGAECTQPAAKASDGTWTVGLTLADGTAATISWKPGVKPILTTHGGTTMQTKIFPLTQNFTLTADDGLTITQTGAASANVSGGSAPPVVTGVSVSGPGTVREGSTAQFIAQVTGTGNYDKSVTWTCSDGTISPTGLFTAPGKVEQVTITATSNYDNTKKGTCPVSIANTGNTVTIAPSGGDDTAALQAALGKLASGQVLQMLVGTWNLSPIHVPGVPLLITPTALILDRKGYGQTDCMFTTSDGSQITGEGAFAQMPNSFAASKTDGSEYRHAFRITGKGPVVTGISVSQAGGDGFNVQNVSNGSLLGASAAKCFRNGVSATDNVNGFLASALILGEQAGGDKIIQCAFDLEPNAGTGATLPCIITIQGCQFLDNKGFPISNGLRLSLNNLTVNNPAVKVLVNNNVARGNTVDYKMEWPSSAGKPSGWIVTGTGNVATNGPTNFPN